MSIIEEVLGIKKIDSEQDSTDGDIPMNLNAKEIDLALSREHWQQRKQDDKYSLKNKGYSYKQQ